MWFMFGSPTQGGAPFPDVQFIIPRLTNIFCGSTGRGWAVTNTKPKQNRSQKSCVMCGLLTKKHSRVCPRLSVEVRNKSEKDCQIRRFHIWQSASGGALCHCSVGRSTQQIIIRLTLIQVIVCWVNFTHTEYAHRNLTGTWPEQWHRCWLKVKYICITQICLISIFLLLISFLSGYCFFFIVDCSIGLRKKLHLDTFEFLLQVFSSSLLSFSYLITFKIVGLFRTEMWSLVIG